MMRQTKFVLILMISMVPVAPDAGANPVGDFFKKIGHSISNLGHSTPPPRKTHKSSKETDDSAKKGAEKPPEGESTAAAETPAPTPVEIRLAAIATPDPKGRRDVPYGVGVPNRPGLVTSPYAPTQGLVDVHAFPSSTEVLDPFTGKIFRTP